MINGMGCEYCMCNLCCLRRFPGPNVAQWNITALWPKLGDVWKLEAQAGCKDLGHILIPSKIRVIRRNSASRRSTCTT